MGRGQFLFRNRPWSGYTRMPRRALPRIRCNRAYVDDELTSVAPFHRVANFTITENLQWHRYWHELSDPELLSDC
jgi:hypothetical protein